MSNDQMIFSTETYNFVKKNKINLKYLDLIRDDRNWLKEKKIYIISGCDTSYIRDYMRTFGTSIYHTFEENTNMDPYSEINNPNSPLWDYNPDYILLSQVQIIRGLIIKINKKEMTNESLEEVEKMYLSQMAEVIKEINKHYANIPIFILSYPYRDIPINGFFKYKYEVDIELFLNNFLLNYYNLSKGFGNVFILDINRSIASIGKNDKTIRLESTGSHLEHLGALLVGERFYTMIKSLNTKIPKIKCIVLDCDNTLWKGTIREDGIKGISIYKQIIEILYFMSINGFILTICSKNDEEDLCLIQKALAESPGFLRSIVVWKVNWHHKSKNITDIASTLNLGLNSFAFFDDNPFERNEVKTNLPEVNVYSEKDLFRFMEFPEFQLLNKSTTDSQNRIQFYKQEFARKNTFNQLSNSENKINYEQFLIKSNFVLEIGPASEDELSRISEIFERTNQMNATMKKLNLDLVYQYYSGKLDSGDSIHKLCSLHLKDNYGEYGIIGAALFRINKSNNSLELLEFAMSCRAMGRSVEDVFIIYFQRLAQHLRVDKISIEIIKTSKNNLICELFQKYSFSKSNDTDKDILTCLMNKNMKISEFPSWFKNNLKFNLIFN